MCPLHLRLFVLVKTGPRFDPVPILHGPRNLIYKKIYPSEFIHVCDTTWSGHTTTIWTDHSSSIVPLCRFLDEFPVILD